MFNLLDDLLSLQLPPSNPDISISVTVEEVDEEAEEMEAGEEDGGSPNRSNEPSGSSTSQRRSRCVRQASLQVI